MGYLRSLGRALLGRRSVGERLVERLKTLDPATLAAFLGEQLPGRVGADYRSLATEGLFRNVAAARAIGDIAMGVASIPVLAEVDGQEREDHPATALLARPNPRQTGFALIEEAVAHYKLDGNSFFLGEAAAAGRRLANVRLLRPDLTEVERARVGRLGATRYTYDPEQGTGRTSGRRRTFVVVDGDPRPAVLQVKTVHPLRDDRGLAPLLPSRDALDRHRLGEEWNSSLIRNAAKPPGHFEFESGPDGFPSLTPDERDALKKELDEVFTGPFNAGRPPVLEGGLKWRQTGLTPVDMDWSGGKFSAMRDVAHALGYPPFLLGLPGDSTFSNQREARLALWEESIIPLARKFYRALERWLQLWFDEPGLRLVLDLDDVPALALRRERIWDRVKGSDWLSTNDKRAATGFDQRPEGEADEVLVSATTVPLGVAVEAEPPEEPGGGSA